MPRNNPSTLVSMSKRFTGGGFTNSTYIAFTREVTKLVHSLGLQNRLALDMGCGSGRYTHFLDRLGFTGIGIDISIKALKKARLHSLDLVCASATALPFRDDSFGVVVSLETLHHLEDIYFNATLREVRRALDSKGWFVFDVKNSVNPFLAAIYKMFRSPLIPLVSRSIFSMRKEVHRLGLHEYKSEVIPYPFVLPSFMKYLAPKVLMITCLARKTDTILSS